MKRIKFIAFTAIVGLSACCFLLFFAGQTFGGISFDLGFMLGLVRGALTPDKENISVPQGFVADVFAEGLNRPTSIAFGPDGRLYAAQLGGEIAALDGKTRAVYASGFTAPLGIAWRGDELYVAWRSTVSVVNAKGERRDIITRLPAARHQTDGVAFGSDGRLYIGQGSRSDHGELVGIDPLEAAILVANPDGSNLRVFAHGLRNPYDLAFHPETGELFATDNGKDVPGVGVPDELNLAVDGAHYGWPPCYGMGKGDNCANTRAPVAEFQEHSSANGMVFYTGDNFPREYRHNLFVALYGSNSTDPLIGRRVERVVLERTPGGYRAVVTTFASGFGSPLDVTVGRDGALYVADFARGKIYRIVWKGG